MAGKLITYCINHILLTVLPVVFKKLMRDKQLMRDEECSQMCIRVAVEFIHILQLHIWIIFRFIDSIRGTEMNNPMWLCISGEVTYIFLCMILFGLCFVSWLPIPGHIFSETWIRMAVEFIYIFYSCLFGLYFVLFTSMTSKGPSRIGIGLGICGSRAITGACPCILCAWLRW